MARTIADLTEGTVVYLDETVDGTLTHEPYIYLGIDEAGNARILRATAAIAKRMNATNVASYSGCEADLWLENEETGFLSRFDAETINALSATSISYTDYTLSGDETVQLVTIARRCFLLSYTEEGWEAIAAGSEGRSYLPALKAYYLAQHPEVSTVTDNAARIGYNPSGSAVSVWMRSANSATNFRFVNTNGNASNYNGATGVGNWLRPALSVAPVTPVSDEGTDAIFLLPDGRKTYWGIEATVSCGKTTARPKRAKVILPHDDFYSLNLAICNNYGDATPTWCTCDEGGVATMGMTKTATDWELGVKISAKGAKAGLHVGEPALIVEFERS